jgi:hypothetical protein
MAAGRGVIRAEKTPVNPPAEPKLIPLGRPDAAPVSQKPDADATRFRKVGTGVAGLISGLQDFWTRAGQG